ncbi:MAG: Winged helix-turn helix [Verrucomicrobiota bacterium]
MPRVGHLIEKLPAVRYHEGHVWRVLGKLGFSCQRLLGGAVERDEH